MTLFEYVSVAVSILLSLGMVHILSRARELLEPGRVYWVHIGQVGLMLVLHPFYWWIFWGFRDVSWTLPLFLYTLVGPSLLCVATTSLIPRNSAQGASWRDHYYAIHRSYFTILALLIMHIALQASLLQDRSWVDPSRLVQGLVLVASVVGAVSTRERLHAGVVVVMLAMVGLSSATLLFQPLFTNAPR